MQNFDEVHTDEAKKRMKFFFKITSIFLFLFLLIFNIVSLNFDGDTLWHIKTGEYIVKNKSFVEADIFSWQQNLNWTPHEQLYEVMLYKIYEIGNLLGVKIFGVCLQFLTVELCLYSNYKRGNLDFGYLIFLFLSYACFPIQATARPHDLSNLIVMIGFSIYYNYYTIAEEKKKKKHHIIFMLYFPIGAILIANFHGGSIYTLYFLPLIYILGDYVYLFTHFHNKTYAKGSLVIQKRLKRTLISVLIGLGLSFINPIGLRIYTYAFKHSNFSYSFINEWKPLSLTLPIIIFLIFELNSFSFTKLHNFEHTSLLRAFMVSFFILATLFKVRFYQLLFFMLIFAGYDSINLMVNRLNRSVTIVTTSTEANKWGNECATSTYTVQFTPLLFRIILGLVRLLKNPPQKIKNIFFYSTCSLISIALFIFGYLLIEGVPFFIKCNNNDTLHYEVSTDCLTDVEIDNETLSYADMLFSLYSQPCIDWLKSHNIYSNYFTDYNSGSFFIFNDMNSFMDARNDPFMSSLSTVNCFQEYVEVFSSPDYAEVLMEYWEKYNIEYIVIFPYCDSLTSKLYACCLDEDNYELVFEDRIVPYDTLSYEEGFTVTKKITEQTYSRGYIFKVLNTKY